MSAKKKWIVYMVRCADQSLYTGITDNLERRIALHEQGKGAKYTRGRGPFDVVYTEQFKNRSDASKRESAIKSLGRKQKLMLCDRKSKSPPRRATTRAKFETK